MNYTLPEEILEVNTKKLVNLLMKASNGRFGESRALNKANQIRESALNTFGITIGTDVFKLQIQLLLEQIQLIEKHLLEIEQIMIEISNRQEHFLTTITGISDVTACVVLGEIGSINRFERPEQLVAYAGLEVDSNQSL